MASNSPNFKDIFPYRTYSSHVKYRDQEFKYIFCKNGSSLALFVFDPQTDKMTLTNAADIALEMIAKDLLNNAGMSEQDLETLFSVGNITLRDSYGDWSQVKVKVTTAQNIQGYWVITGARVSNWRHFNLTKEFLELFQFLG